MSELRYPEWRDSNERVKYPFDMNATMQNGLVILPDNLFADARVHPLGGGMSQYISSIVKTSTTLSFVIADSSLGVMATGVFTVASPSTKDVISLKDRFGRDAGVLVTDIARLTPLLGWSDGTYDFELEQTRLCQGVVIPMPQGDSVNSIRPDDTAALAGEVWIVGGLGVVLEVAPGDPTVILVHAAGEPRYKQLTCDESFSFPCPVRTINGVKPDPYGEFQIVPCGLLSLRSVLRVVPMEHGIRIEVASGGE
jgi:hypothetical protein